MLKKLIEFLLFILIIKMKCDICKKKILFDSLSESCKCGKITCLNCRFPNHDCHFDYHEQAKKKIKMENPKIESQKLVKI